MKPTKPNDTRRKSIAAQIALKNQALELIRSGITQTAIAAQLGVSRYSVNTWAQQLAKDPGMVAIQAKRGRKAKEVQS